jgi:serine protease Do
VANSKQTKQTKSGDSKFSVSSSGQSRQGKSLTVALQSLPSQIQNVDWQRVKHPNRWGARVLAILFIIVSLLGGYVGAWLENHNNNGSVTFADLSNQEKVVTSQSQLIDQIAKSVGPSVVSVNVDINSTGSSTATGSGSQDGFGLFGFSQPEEEQAAGTGIILSSDGLIITNRHVVPTGTTNVSVTLSNGTELKDVSVIGRTSQNSSLDIAFLKIKNTSALKLTPAVVGDSSQVQVGDSVVAIGNALGQFQNTVTSGIISGYGRTVEASDSSGDSSTDENLDDLFQTDAAINEGNSGGPLVNMNGQVIGIDTAVASDAQSIGFAIPINDVKGLIEQVIKTGKFSTPYLGVRYIPLTADVADEYHLSVTNGAFVAPSNNSSSPSVIAGSPAAKAGLQVNDVITAVNGTQIDQGHSLTSLLDQHVPGDTVKLTILRAKQTLQINVTLSATPSS